MSRLGKSWIGVLLLALVAAFLVACAGEGESADDDGGTARTAETAEATTDDGDDDDGDDDGEVREIVVSMQDNFFEPAEIRVQAGETVKIVAKNDGAAVHNMIVSTEEVAGKDFMSDALVNPGESSEFEMTIEQAGSYEFYCAFHLPGMVGTVIVE